MRTSLSVPLTLSLAKPHFYIICHDRTVAPADALYLPSPPPLCPSPGFLISHDLPHHQTVVSPADAHGGRPQANASMHPLGAANHSSACCLRHDVHTRSSRLRPGVCERRRGKERAGKRWDRGKEAGRGKERAGKREGGVEGGKERTSGQHVSLNGFSLGWIKTKAKREDVD
jgi:hypothetical protein